MAEVITVSQLNHYVKMRLDADDALFDLALRGEIANFVQNAKSGHCYFSLRDAQCSVRAVMFKSDTRRLEFRPENGMQVIVRCRVTLYERDGAFQVYVTDLFPDGIGSKQLAFEQLKARLEAEGLFAAAHKVPIPAQPACIGLVTSKTGAALQDILQITARRWPLVRLLLCPVHVQGIEAAGEIARAIDALDHSRQADVIIVARGGGSSEDLWVFNTEAVARAAYRCKTPLISAIGHEIDFTILDFVADLRAPTPSAAAELAVPDMAEVRHKISSLKQNIQHNMQNRLQLCYNKLEQYPAQRFSGAAQAGAARREDQVNRLCGRLRGAAHAAQQASATRFAHAAALAGTLDPYHTLARGYALVQDHTGQVLRTEQLTAGQKIRVVGAQRTALCTVDATEGNGHENP